MAIPAAASRPAEVIVLPGARSAEGIAAGRGTTFYAGDLFAGDIFRGSIRRGTAERFIDAPPGRMAVGMAADLRHDLLFVAGGFTGQGYVYDLRTGATVASYQFAAPSPHRPPPSHPPRSSMTWPSPATAPGSPIHDRPSCTSCRSAEPGSQGHRSGR